MADFSFTDVLLSRHGEHDTICVSAYKNVNGHFVVSEKFCAGVSEAAGIIERNCDRTDIGAFWTNIQRLKPGSTARKKGVNIDAYTNITVDIDRKYKMINAAGEYVVPDKDCADCATLKDEKRKCDKHTGHKCNATDAEIEVLRKVAEEIAAFLTKDFGPFAFAFSGNGFHSNWKLADLDPVEGHRYYRRLLALLKAKFERPELNVEIDASLADDTQVVTVWGTWNRKYPDTPDRPQRQSQVLLLPTNQKLLHDYDLEIFLADNRVEGTEKQEELVPKAGDDKQKADPQWLEDHGVAHLVDFFKEFIAYEDEGEYEKADGDHHPIHPCPCHEHEDFHVHSHPRDCEIIVFKDGGIGISCFSRDFGLKQVIKKLNGLKGENYPFMVYAEATDEEVKKAFGLVEVDDLTEEESIEVPDSEPVIEPGEPEVNKTRLKVDRIKYLATGMIGVILRDPSGTLPQFRLLKSRLDKTLMEYIEAPLHETLTAILSYYDDIHLLPTQGELLNFLDESSIGVARMLRDKTYFSNIRSFVANIQDDPTLEFAPIAAELERTVKLEAQKRNTKKNWDKYLKKGSLEDVQAFRIAERQHTQKELRSKGDIVGKPMQMMTEVISAEFLKDIDGANDAGKVEIGFPPIDHHSHIGLNGERTICIYGPANSGKTTFLMTCAVNMAERGKNILILIGEHQAIPMMKTLTLMLGPSVKDEIGVLPDRDAWEGINRTATKEDWERINRLLEMLRERLILPGWLGVENINAIAGTDEDRLGACIDYIHSFHMTYPLDGIIIDPLDQVMPLSAMGKDNAWAEGKEVLQRIQNLSRSFEGREGKGLMIITSVQFTSKMQREIEKQQAKTAIGDAQDDIILSLMEQTSQIQFYTTIPQDLDAMIGIVTRLKRGTDGYLYGGRFRFGSTFKQMSFVMDPIAHIITAKGPATYVAPAGRAAAAAAPDGGQPAEQFMEALDDL